MTTPATKITFACQGCGRAFSVPATFVGRKATCKTCGNRVVVPGESQVAAPLVVGAAASDNGESDGHLDSNERAALMEIAVAEITPTATDVMPPQRAFDPATTESLATPVEDGAGPATAEAVEPAASAEVQAPSPAAPKVPMRIRRLMVDAEQVKKAFSTDGPIRVKNTVGDPPELYQVEYKVKSLQRGWLGKPKKRDTHLVEIQLTSEYPRMSPHCRMLTPVFHPNIDETTICVGDHWTAGERLVDLIIRIGQMLAYQDYNIKSPLNGEAAMWADLNPTKLPTDPQNLHLADAL